LRRQVRYQTEVIRQNQREMLDISRRAGMAEVATNVLHNVGNVLNSVNVSGNVIEERLRQSKTKQVRQIAELMSEHSSDLGEFITKDSKGSRIPKYLGGLAEHLIEEEETILKEVAELLKNIGHIKDIVTLQQSYAGVGGMSEKLKAVDLLEDALRMSQDAFAQRNIRVVREYPVTVVPEIAVERHKVIQILVNLLQNAKHACADSGKADKRVFVRMTQCNGHLKMSVTDNGVGIAAENLTRIFNHGFTTRKNGHGFGLHSGALAAREMGGSLIVQSDGLGMGASFTLELPFNREKI
jgi:signal transduction histidine kinase